MQLQAFHCVLLASLWAIVSSEEDPCLLPPLTGRCRAHKLRFHFNDSTKKCEAFVYGGCGGNGNNFDTLSACHEACKSHLDHPDADTASVHVKNEHCLGPQLRSPVMCMAYFPRVTFNANTLTCEPYIYGGCGATSNVYLSEVECQTSCYYGNVMSRGSASPRGLGMRSRAGPVTSVGGPSANMLIGPPTDEDDICNLPPVTPHLMACYAFMPKWTHDARQGRCIEYTYGGCHATKNLFNSQEECDSVCPPAMAARHLPGESMWIRPPFCNGPPINGTRECRAYMPSFTYDVAKGRCVNYIYGGCGATQNVFEDETTCVKTCDMAALEPRKTVGVCALPIERGPCKAMKPLHAYNKDKRRCERFLYGGCGGNDNRFNSVEDCVNTCGGQEPEASVLCSQITCDMQDATFHKSKGCVPVIRPGECCPSSWDCSVWEERLRRKDKCFWADVINPRGKYYNDGDDMPEASGGCRKGCMCTVEGKTSDVVCAIADCGYFPPPMGARHCVDLYESLDDCCPYDRKCDDDLEGFATCSVGNTTYVSGEKIEESRKTPCEQCMCKDGEVTCVNFDCALNYNRKLLEGCQPVYRKDYCCPVDWVCPSTRPQRPPTGKVAKLMVKCPPGVSIRQGVDFAAPRPPVEKIDRLSDRLAPVTSAPDQDTSNADDVCLLPKALGPCEGYMDMWYFDQLTRKCQPYKYGGSERGNVFPTKEDCERICSVYMLDSDDGECEAQEESGPSTSVPNDRCMPKNKYRYNQAAGQCQDYSMMGCATNTNSYRTIEECEARCLRPLPRNQIASGKSPNCNLPIKVGNCRSKIRRYYYDQTNGICRMFWYGGCQGNGNNFLDEQSCISACVPKDSLVRALQPRELVVKNPCQQPKEIGPCRAKKPMYYFDSETKTCRVFFYGGCLGNENRFATFGDCLATCTVDKSAQKNMRRACEQPRQAGTCRAFMPSSWYNMDTQKCERFIYGGCGGNQNRYATSDECMASCVFYDDSRPTDGGVIQVGNAVTLPAQITPRTSDPCILPRAIGRCRAAIKRFYFDNTSGQCQHFFYGGCQGNDNNFATLEDCQSRCASHLSSTPEPSTNDVSRLPANPICSLPVKVGPCKALKPLFYYNTQTLRCERFIYGGCQGNDNRFPTLAECVHACGRSPRGMSARGMRSDNLLPSTKPALPKCTYNGAQFHVGDILRLGGNQCTKCECVAPPDLTCTVQECPQIRFHPTGNSACEPVKDEDGCCTTGYRCTPKRDQGRDCARRICVAIGFLSPPGETCSDVSDGCCQGGIQCIEN